MAENRFSDFFRCIRTNTSSELPENQKNTKSQRTNEFLRKCYEHAIVFVLPQLTRLHFAADTIDVIDDEKSKQNNILVI